jgi:hypothetical protein
MREKNAIESRRKEGQERRVGGKQRQKGEPGAQGHEDRGRVDVIAAGIDNLLVYRGQERNGRRRKRTTMKDGQEGGVMDKVEKRRVATRERASKSRSETGTKRHPHLPFSSALQNHVSQPRRKASFHFHPRGFVVQVSTAVVNIL